MLKTLRLKNASKKGTQTIYGPSFDNIGLIKCLKACKDSKHYQSKLKKDTGRGVGVGFWFNVGFSSSVIMHLNPDGTVLLLEGNPDIGGSRASLQLMAAETLQIPPDNIKAILADTETVARNDVTGGSRTTFATGLAVIRAGEDIVKQLKERAAKIWETKAEKVTYKNGFVSHKKERLSIQEMAEAATKTGGQISGVGNITADGAGPSFSVHIADIKIDKETGKSTVTRYTASQDAGKAIHPTYVEGQIQGGAVQGIGWALNEEYIYDKQGRLENPGFLDYRVPVASDLPSIDAIIVEEPNPNHPFGVRGVGEANIIPPLSSVATAVSQAIGKTLTDLPLSPPKVLNAILKKD